MQPGLLLEERLRKHQVNQAWLCHQDLKIFEDAHLVASLGTSSRAALLLLQ